MASEEKSKSPDFDSIKQTNVYGIEFWSARELAPLLGYVQWRRFEDAIKRAKISCKTNGDVVENHFANADKVVQLGSGAEREINDYALTRYACYLIAQNGDPRKPEIAAAQAYFIISARAYEMHQIREEQEMRLEMRMKVSESYKQLGKAAQNAGVQSESFGVFIDAGYLGLHHHTLQELKDRKGIPENDDYLDRIGREELSAIDFKNVLTDRKLRDDSIVGLDEASNTHYFVGDQIRQTIKRINQPMPEDMPVGSSIRKLVEERRRATKKWNLKATEQKQQQEPLFFAQD